MYYKRFLFFCQEYARFVAKVREKQNELDSLEAALDAALQEMPEGFIIHAFLLSNKAEVKRMCITEYYEARTRADDREEGKEDVQHFFVKQMILLASVKPVAR